jgi:hypothetical protein
MDNRIFNVNGKTKTQLKLALDCALFDEYGEIFIQGWYISPKKGFVLVSSITDEDKTKVNPFTDRLGIPSSVNAHELLDILWNWLSCEESNTIECEEWDKDIDQDGVNMLGWRLYTEDWGCIHGDEYDNLQQFSLFAFKPAYIWYGK